jgi:hypothetical protein
MLSKNKKPYAISRAGLLAFGVSSYALARFGGCEWRDWCGEGAAEI